MIIMIIGKYLKSLRNLPSHSVEIFEQNLLLKHKFEKTSCITQAHFDVLRMNISA